MDGICYTSSLENNYAWGANFCPINLFQTGDSMGSLSPYESVLPYTATSREGQNGRVAFADQEAKLFLPEFKTNTAVESDFQTDMLRGNWEKSPVSEGFFSAENMALLQNRIRKAVFDRSQPKGYVIDDQSTDELKIIMRAIYYQYARNMPKDVKAQVEDLNRKVIDWSVPHILSAVDHYHFYLNDISHMPVPLARSVSLSSAGTKSLPLSPFM
jgi:hypothetical protein